MDTREWALSHGVCVDANVPAVDDYHEPYSRTAEEIAIRTVILHCVAAVGYGVDAQPVVEWLEDQALRSYVSLEEWRFLSAVEPSEEEQSDARWRQEAQWALLWTIGKIESLGLPTRTCDTARLVDEIMPALGDSIDEYVGAAQLRPVPELIGEDDRIYNLHCYARQTQRTGSLPFDLVYPVLFQRHYAFSWLGSGCDWDDVETDT